jgi:protein-tyrosine phosphatase
MLTDLHCHILPAIDDGSKSLEQSLAMARIAVEDGITTTVVTPHHMNGVYNNPAEQVREAVRALKQALFSEGIQLELLPGSELHLVPELPDQVHRGEALTIADRGHAVLVELPVHTVPMGAENILDHLLSMGLTPVIAHPERNSELRRDPDRLARWVQMGCLGQVTAQSCTGNFGDAIRDAARTMVRQGSIHVVASDAHRDARRVPQITIARKPIVQWAGEDAARLLIDAFPTRLGQGEIPDVGLLLDVLPARVRKPWWRRMF